MSFSAHYFRRLLKSTLTREDAHTRVKSENNRGRRNFAINNRERNRQSKKKKEYESVRERKKEGEPRFHLNFSLYVLASIL